MFAQSAFIVFSFTLKTSNISLLPSTLFFLIYKISLSKHSHGVFSLSHSLCKLLLLFFSFILILSSRWKEEEKNIYIFRIYCEISTRQVYIFINTFEISSWRKYFDTLCFLIFFHVVSRCVLNAHPCKCFLFNRNECKHLSIIGFWSFYDNFMVLYVA